MTTPPFYVRWLQEAHSGLDHVIAQVDADRQRIRLDESLSAQGRREALVELRESAELQIAAIKVRAEEAQESARRHIAEVLRPSTDTAQRLLEESQDQRAWQRARALLEAGTDVNELIARAGKTGDVATLRALRSEFPSWLETNAVAAAPDLQKPNARTAAQVGVAPLLEDIDRAEALHLPSRQRTALETKFQVKALDEVLRAKQLLVDAVIEDRNVGGALIRSGLATTEAEKGLMGSPSASPGSELADVMAARSAS